MYDKESLVRIASELGCKYEDKCSNHTRASLCPTCLQKYKQRHCAHETRCSSCEAADALRFVAKSL